MHLSELVDRTRGLMAALGARLNPGLREDVVVYLDTGEEGLALEFLMGGLIHDRVPVTRIEADEVLALLCYFSDIPEETGDARPDEPDHYWAITNPSQAVAELNIQG